MNCKYSILNHQARGDSVREFWFKYLSKNLSSKICQKIFLFFLEKYASNFSLICFRIIFIQFASDLFLKNLIKNFFSKLFLKIFFLKFSEKLFFLKIFWINCQNFLKNSHFFQKFMYFNFFFSKICPKFFWKNLPKILP